MDQQLGNLQKNARRIFSEIISYVNCKGVSDLKALLDYSYYHPKIWIFPPICLKWYTARAQGRHGHFWQAMPLQWRLHQRRAAAAATAALLSILQNLGKALGALPAMAALMLRKVKQPFKKGLGRKTKFQFSQHDNMNDPAFRSNSLFQKDHQWCLFSRHACTINYLAADM